MHAGGCRLQATSTRYQLWIMMAWLTAAPDTWHSTLRGACELQHGEDAERCARVGDEGDVGTSAQIGLEEGLHLMLSNTACLTQN